ncbi:Na+/phosphate symporter [Amaricoccus macauensis]|uniref:Na+/phosphate symporter n=1 Tax=Amaricoccus macauensis TaxID=57001 RepID=A0A840SHT0_9RHOB|nr:hypothetical protein [Amaricoccus macauensis]MBB5220494.1 Na+/phosphate symporter [Amaricoccus macauensis]
MPDTSDRGLDHHTLAALAREVEDADPIAWGGLALDRETVYDLIASQIAELFQGYEQSGVPRDRQMLIALSTVVKLTVENFVLHQRVMRAADAESRDE